MPGDAREALPPLEAERWELLKQLEDWLETPMAVLGFVWLGLLIAELTWGLSPVLTRLGTLIWGLFVLDFTLKLTLAPHKLDYIRKNWLTALALALPALRVFRLVRQVRVLRVARAARGVRFFWLVTSLNRGVRALRATLARRGFGYVLALTLIMTFAGAAGMYAFETEAPGGGFHSFWDALWWTAMLMTTSGSEYWPQSAEARLLCFLLALYAFAAFGYVTATLATFFVGKDVESAAAQHPETAALAALREEITLLRAEVRSLARARGAENGRSDYSR